MATCATDGVKLWDLRKLRNFKSLAPYEGAPTAAVSFDHSGLFLGVGGAGEPPGPHVQLPRPRGPDQGRLVRAARPPAAGHALATHSTPGPHHATPLSTC